MPVIINTLQKFRIIYRFIRQRLTRADCKQCTLFNCHLLIYMTLQSDQIPSPKSKMKDSQTTLKIAKEICCLLHSPQMPAKKCLDMQTGGESGSTLAV